MGRLEPFHQHDEDVAFPCPCGGMVVAKLVLPTLDGRIALIGNCPRCIAARKPAATIAYLKAEDRSEASRFKRYRETSRFVYRNAA